MKQKIAILFCIIIFFTLIAAHTSQAALVNCGGYDSSGKLQECKIGDLITTIKVIINTLLSWAWLISIAFIVWSGFRMISAGGNEETIANAKSSLTSAIVGFIIILVSFVLINTVVGMLTGNGLNGDALIEAFQLAP